MAVVAFSGRRERDPGSIGVIVHDVGHRDPATAAMFQLSQQW